MSTTATRGIDPDGTSEIITFTHESFDLVASFATDLDLAVPPTDVADETTVDDTRSVLASLTTHSTLTSFATRTRNASGSVL